MFKRQQHNRIAQVLHALNGRRLLEQRCLFAGGTVIAMRYGEYRESVDIDFLVSDAGCYRNLREMLTRPQGIQALVREGGVPLTLMRDLRADQYGIRTMLLANSDSWNDDGVFSRDLIDLAMMSLPLPLLRLAVSKAEQAYGESILRDLAKAIDVLQNRNGWLERCMQVLAMSLPKAQLWQKVRALRRVLR